MTSVVNQIYSPISLFYPGFNVSYGGVYILWTESWEISLVYFPLTVTLGGIVIQAGVVEKRTEIREYLCITLSFDHDAIDGASSARFIHQIRRLVTVGFGLENY
jgi:pyruvate/2-oxoglutarate dehydrogenase complex dihydrolipoamide acyltransferase (E2) component